MKLLTAALLVTVSIHTVFADYAIELINDVNDSAYFFNGCSKRICQCLSGTQTNKIKNTNGGLVRVFSTTDCTGNYDTIAIGSTISNAQWVNSVSLGQSGTSYQVGKCSNLFNDWSVSCP